MATVLIVDDSKSQQYEMTQIITEMGHTVISAENGVAGVLKAKAEMPDLILMDVVMPELNGFQATRQISRNPGTENIPIIMVSTKDQETDKVWGGRQGAKEYITKPINKKEFIAAVQNYI